MELAQLAGVSSGSESGDFHPNQFANPRLSVSPLAGSPTPQGFTPILNLSAAGTRGRTHK